MTTDNTQTDTEVSGEERAIPTVGKSAKQGRDNFVPTLLIFLSLALVVILLYTVMSAEDEESFIDKEQKTFDRENVVNLDIPKKIPPLVKPAQPTVTTTPVMPQASARDELFERRKRAPIVIYDKLPESTATIDGAFRVTDATTAEQKQMALLNNLDSALSNSGQGSSLLGGSKDREGLSSRIVKTNTTGVKASLIDKAQQPFIIAQGKMISAVLETAIQSDLPGMVRAVVAEDVYSLDGTLRLLEKGSRLVGEYQGGVKQGETRVFVTWNRIITPNGVDVELGSPGTGPLGRSGLAGWVDRHFLERFGSSILLSVVGAFSAKVAGDNSEGDQQIRDDISDNFNKSSEIALEHSINIPPTIHINQGEYIKVFVARDIDFKQAYLLNEQQKSGVP